MHYQSKNKRPPYSQYFSHLAHLNSKTELISEAVVANFKQLTKNNISSGSHLDLKIIEHQIPELYRSSIALFGKAPLFTNLFRVSIRPLIREGRLGVIKLAKELTDKLTLVLNQSIYLPFNNQLEAQGTYATFLLQILEILENLEINLVSTSQFSFELEVPVNFIEDNKLYLEFSHILGFKHTREQYLPFHQENQFIADLCHFYSRALAAWELTYQTIRYNRTDHGTMPSFHRISSNLRGCLAQLKEIDIDSQDRIHDWDEQLQTLVAHLGLLNELFYKLGHEIVGLVSPQKLRSQKALPKQTENWTTLSLISKGIGILKATEAATNLVNYCNRWETRLSEIDKVELPQIDQTIDSATLEHLKAIDRDRKLNLKQSERKEMALNAAKLIINNLQRGLVTLIIAGFASFSLPSCGVKTPPVSNVLDLKPEIPYKKSAKITPENEKSIENPKNVEPKDES